MENLEKEIINRLNKILSKYGLKINNNAYNLLDVSYYLYDEITDKIIWGWESIDEMLFSPLCSLFRRLNRYHEDILYFSSIQVDIKRTKNFEICERYADAYNVIKQFENIGCLEELAIKMDLMGI